MSGEYKIRIKTEADDAAAQQAARTMGDVNEATRRAADSADQAAASNRRVKQSLDDTEGSADTVYYLAQGFQDLTEGRIITGVQDIAAGMKNLAASVVANPFGILVAGVTAATGAISVYIQKQREMKQQQAEWEESVKEYAQSWDDLQKEVKISVDQIVAHAQSLNESGRMDADAIAGGIAEKFRLAADEAARLRIEMEAAADLDLSAEMARIELGVATGDIEQPEAERQRQTARVRAAERRSDAVLQELAQREKAAQQQFDEAKQQQSSATTNFQNQSDVATTKESEAEQAQRVLEYLVRKTVMSGSTGFGGDQFENQSQKEAAVQRAEEDLRRAQEESKNESQKVIELDQKLQEANRQLVESRRQLQSISRQREFQGQASEQAADIRTTETKVNEIRQAQAELDQLNDEIEKKKNEERLAEIDQLKEQLSNLEQALDNANKATEEARQNAASGIARGIAGQEATEAADANAEAAGLTRSGSLPRQRENQAVRDLALLEQQQADEAGRLAAGADAGKGAAIEEALRRGSEIAAGGSGNEKLVELATSMLSLLEEAKAREETLENEVAALKSRLDNMRDY